MGSHRLNQPVDISAAGLSEPGRASDRFSTPLVAIETATPDTRRLGSTADGFDDRYQPARLLCLD